MNASHFHLIFVYIPVIGLFITAIVNLYALIKKESSIQKLTLWMYIMLGAFVLLAQITGDGAKEIVKTYPGVSEDVIETHENTALFFTVGLLLTCGMAVIGLFKSHTKEYLLKKFNIYLWIMALAILILAAMTASTGSKIRHVEIEQGMYKELPETNK